MPNPNQKIADIELKHLSSPGCEIDEATNLLSESRIQCWHIDEVRYYLLGSYGAIIAKMGNSFQKNSYDEMLGEACDSASREDKNTYQVLRQHFNTRCQTSKNASEHLAQVRNQNNSSVINEDSENGEQLSNLKLKL